jgi:hypothetical protein
MTASNAAIAESTAPARHKALHPRSVAKQADGFVFREWVVRLPFGMSVNDLIEQPTLWRIVQGDPRTALQKLDRVVVLDFDEAVAAEAIVSAASDTSVTLARPRLTDLQSRTTEPQIEDELHRVVWDGGNYVVKRKSDGQVMTQPTPSRRQAERDLANLRPRRV